jgi:hypothetical protein
MQLIMKIASDAYDVSTSQIQKTLKYVMAIGDNQQILHFINDKQIKVIRIRGKRKINADR